MPTLTLVTRKTKITLKWLVFLSVFGFFMFVSYTIGMYVKEQVIPSRPPTPTVSFGKLPRINFPPNNPEQQLTYTIDTVSGFLPTIDPQAKVYKMDKPRPQFLALDIAREKVTSVGFRSSETRLSDNWYRWTNQGYPYREITYDIYSNDFSITSQFLSDPLAPRFLNNFQNQNPAVNAAQNFLTRISNFPEGFDTNLTKTLYYSIDENGNLNSQTSVSNAQIIRVDFFEESIDGLPIYHTNPTTSGTNLLIANIQNNTVIIGGNYNRQSPSSESHTYPLKTSAEAFIELKDGNAYIASYFGESTNVEIKDVFLAYYIGSEKQDFLMPIIVFEGDDGFYAYVSAVRDEWIDN